MTKPTITVASTAMTKQSQWIKRLILLGTSAALLAACGGQGSAAGSSQSVPSQSGASSQSTAVVVKASNFAFQPQSLTVKVGTTVSFQNADSAPHTLTANSGAFDTGQVGSGQSSSFTVSSAGTFPFHCKLHPSMTGTISATS
jgi:plastocyanin